MPNSYHPMQPALYERLLESQYWPRTKLETYQHDKLERLLRHAREYVPFYKSRLDCLFTSRGDIDWTRWIDVPIVKRKDVFEFREDMLSELLPVAHGQTFDSKTSGSTGMRIAVRHSALSSCVNQAAAFRGHTWHGLDWSKNILFVLGTDPDKETIDSLQARASWGPGWMAESVGEQFMLNRFLAPSDLLRFIAENQIGYLVTRPIEAHALAMAALEYQSDVRLHGIIGVGTAIRPNERTDCFAAFGAAVVTPYGAKEGGQMAFPCPVSGHYHLSEENVLIEVLDEEDRPCGAGQPGRVIVTPLYNFAQPFIRYEQGDVAVLGEPCACGRTLRVLGEIVGRQEHLFQFPGGKKFAMTINYDLMEEFGVRHWQIAQTGPLSVEVRYVPKVRKMGDPSPISNAIKAKAQRADITVSFKALEEIARQPGGKILSYVYEVPNAQVLGT